MDVHATQNHYFCVHALWVPDTKKVVPQVEVGVSPHDDLTQSHEGRNMQDPRGG
jgi:hypothetical protein